MSHVSTVQANIKDLDALEVAAAHLGGKLERDVASFSYWNRRASPCAHRLVFEGRMYGAPIHVGVVKAAEGGEGFLLAMDNDVVRHVVGRDAGLLRQRYSVEVAKRTAQLRGMRVLGEKVQQDGSIKLRLAVAR